MSITNFIRISSEKKSYSAWITVTSKILTWLPKYLSDQSAKRNTDRIL